MDEESAFKRKLLIAAVVLALAISGQVWWNRKHPAKPSGIMDEIAKAMPPSATRTVVEKLNFSYTKPDDLWSVGESALWVGPIAFTMMRLNPLCSFVIVGNADGGTETSAREQMAKLAKPTKNAFLENNQHTEALPHVINGMEGLRYEVTGADTFGVTWVYAVNGYRYMLGLSGRPAAKAEIIAQADTVFRGFVLLDPSRRAPVKESTDWRDFHSRHGYRVQVKAPHWNRFDGLEEHHPVVEFGLVSQEKGGLLAFAAGLGETRPANEALARACLAVAGVPPEEARKPVLKEIKEGPWSGVRWSFAGQGDRTNLLYQQKLLRGSNQLWCAIAWVEQSHATPDAFLERALAMVTLPDAAPPTPPALAEGDAREQRLHGELMNRLGLHYLKAGQPTVARDYFPLALATRQDRAYLVNYFEASVAAGQYEDTLKYLESQTAWLGEDAGFLARRAFLQARGGQAEAALKNYAAAFDAGFKDEPMLMDYLRLLARTDRADLAAAKLAAYLKEKDTLVLRLTQAALLRQQKKFSEAIALLKEQEKRHGFNAPLSREFVECYHEAGRPKDAIEECARLLAKGHDTAETHVAKAKSELALKAYRQAKVSLEIALEKDPGNAAARDYLRQLPGAER